VRQRKIFPCEDVKSFMQKAFRSYRLRRRTWETAPVDVLQRSNTRLSDDAAKVILHVR
jgi:hypothetical protein